MISLISCSQNKQTIKSDFCQLHEPLPTNLSKDIIVYLKEKKQIISAKNKEGNLKTPEEKFIEIMINYSGANEKKYYEKNCK